MKIMYVEDNPANISLLQRIARMGGHQVINYTSGEGVLDNFEKDQPHLVLMDLQLEGRMTGLEIVKILRERGFRTPIIAVTAYAMVGDRERCIEAGCDSYLSKPLPVAELVELVQAYELKSKTAEAPAAPVTAKAPTANETPAEAPNAPVTAETSKADESPAEAPKADETPAKP